MKLFKKIKVARFIWTMVYLHCLRKNHASFFKIQAMSLQIQGDQQQGNVREKILSGKIAPKLS